MKKFSYLLVTLLCMAAFSVSARTYYVAVDGDDSQGGTIEAPFATLNRAQELVLPGDTVYFRGGTYHITEDQVMTATSTNGVRAHVFEMDKSGTEAQRIHYFGYEGERPIFDLSAVRPVDRRVCVFFVSGSYLHFKNFEVVGTQVTISEHTQSECFRNEGGNNNIFEYLAMHDGMAIGFYLASGSNNLVLNCDAYNNYDDFSEGGAGGNTDGFGGHPASGSSTGNVFRSCRAWWNSDDGFDLISANAVVTIEDCWAFYNGYKPGTFDRAGDGTGIKAGGYGMSADPGAPSVIPMHVIRNNVAFGNPRGFYANHHLGGILWENNTSYKNGVSNFNMTNRISPEVAEDVPGYGHILRNNLSFGATANDISMVDEEKSQFMNNSFLPVPMVVTADDFLSLDENLAMLPRLSDGKLQDVDLLKLKTTSVFFAAGMGHFYTRLGDIESFDWIEEPTIIVQYNVARVIGNGAARFNSFFVNGVRVPFTTGSVDLNAYSGEINLRAETVKKEVIRLKMVKE